MSDRWKSVEPWNQAGAQEQGQVGAGARPPTPTTRSAANRAASAVIARLASGDAVPAKGQSATGPAGGGAGDGAAESDDRTYDWVAPSTAASVTITFRPTDDPKVTRKVVIQVIPPGGVKMVRTSAPPYPNTMDGAASAMMITDVFFTPF